MTHACKHILSLTHLELLYAETNNIYICKYMSDALMHIHDIHFTLTRKGRAHIIGGRGKHSPVCGTLSYRLRTHSPVCGTLAHRLWTHSHMQETLGSFILFREGSCAWDTFSSLGNTFSCAGGYYIMSWGTYSHLQGTLFGTHITGTHSHRLGTLFPGDTLSYNGELILLCKGHFHYRKKIQCYLG